MLEPIKNEQGVFLVRSTQRDENILVLSIMCNNEFYNYEICVVEKTENDLAPKFYFIDDGPYFRTLPHLIEHYTKYADGLPGLLRRAISPLAQLIPIQIGPSNKTISKSSLNSSCLNLNDNQTLMNLSNQLLIQETNEMNSSTPPRHSTPLESIKQDELFKIGIFKNRTLLKDQS